MATNDLGSILKRIDKRLEAVKLTDRAASLAAGMSADAIRTMRRQWENYKKNLPGPKQKTATAHTLTKLSRPLQTTGEWLMAEIGPEDVGEVMARRQQTREAKETAKESRRGTRGATPEPAKGSATIPVLAEVHAGTWREVEIKCGVESMVYTEVPAAPGYPAHLQHAAIVRGNSISRVANIGDFLIVLNVAGSGVTPRNGDLVVAVRRRDSLYETSAKRYHVSPNEATVELRYDSHDPQYADNVAVRLPMLPAGGAATKAEDGTEVIIKGIVLAIYRLPQHSG